MPRQTYHKVPCSEADQVSCSCVVKRALACFSGLLVRTRRLGTTVSPLWTRVSEEQAMSPGARALPRDDSRRICGVGPWPVGDKPL